MRIDLRSILDVKSVATGTVAGLTPVAGTPVKYIPGTLDVAVLLTGTLTAGEATVQVSQADNLAFTQNVELIPSADIIKTDGLEGVRNLGKGLIFDATSPRTIGLIGLRPDIVSRPYVRIDILGTDATAAGDASAVLVSYISTLPSKDME